MILIFIILGLLPSFAWLFFFLKEDLHPEPKRMLAKVFFAGALMTIPATLIQIGIENLLRFLSLNEVHIFIFALFAPIEEILKFVIVWLIISKNPYFDEPIDAMIYMITAALGFALIENAAAAATSIDFTQALTLTIIRFVGATLLHALSSAIVGYYWAKGVIIGNWSSTVGRSSLVLAEGIAIASVLHMTFNYLIINSRELFIYSIIFLVFTAFFVFWDFEKVKQSQPYKTRS